MAKSLDSSVKSTWSWKRSLVLLVLLLCFVTALVLFRDKLSLTKLAEYEQALRAFQTAHPILVYFLAFALYVVVTALSIPVATALSLLFGWYFGFWRAFVIVSFASTLGATCAFLLSRYLFRSAIEERFGYRLRVVNEAIEREGAIYLLILRLTPVVPFFITNAVVGLTKIGVWTFWWASQIGMLPNTIIYVYAGSATPSLKVLAEQGVQGLPWARIFFALTLLALSPLVVRRLIRFFHSRPAA